MKTYTLKFELFGKKMKTDVMALSEDRAKDMIRRKIIFHSVSEKETDEKQGDATLERLKGIFGMR